MLKPVKRYGLPFNMSCVPARETKPAGVVLGGGGLGGGGGGGGGGVVPPGEGLRFLRASLQRDCALVSAPVSFMRSKAFRTPSRSASSRPSAIPSSSLS